MSQPKYKLFQQLKSLVQTIYDMMIKYNKDIYIYYSTDTITFKYEKDLYIAIQACPTNSIGNKFVIITATERYENHKSYTPSQFIYHLIDKNIETVLIEDLIFKLQEHLIVII